MVRDFSKSILAEEIKKSGLIVLDFYAGWCGPCRSFSAIFEECALTMNKEAVFGKVNIDEQRDLAIEYKISSIPTVLIVKDGQLVWSHVGAVSLDVLKNKISFFTK
jgi:thioredoxin